MASMTTCRPHVFFMFVQVVGSLIRVPTNPQRRIILVSSMFSSHLFVPSTGICLSRLSQRIYLAQYNVLLKYFSNLQHSEWPRIQIILLLYFNDPGRIESPACLILALTMMQLEPSWRIARTSPSPKQSIPLRVRLHRWVAVFLFLLGNTWCACTALGARKSVNLATFVWIPLLFKAWMLIFRVQMTSSIKRVSHHFYALFSGLVWNRRGCRHFLSSVCRELSLVQYLECAIAGNSFYGCLVLSCASGNTCGETDLHKMQWPGAIGSLFVVSFHEHYALEKSCFSRTHVGLQYLCILTHPTLYSTSWM